VFRTLVAGVRNLDVHGSRLAGFFEGAWVAKDIDGGGRALGDPFGRNRSETAHRFIATCELLKHTSLLQELQNYFCFGGYACQFQMSIASYRCFEAMQHHLNARAV
jgi:hypothetical protein